MASIKDVIEKRSDYYRLSPKYLSVREGWNVRDTTTKEYKEHIEQLADSIDEMGVQEPLKGEWDSKENLFYITNGHCRYAALKLLEARGVTDIKSVPVILEEKGKNISPEERALTMLTSNSGLALSALEKAEVFKRLYNKGWTVQEIAKKGAVCVPDVYDKLLLSSAPAELIQMIKTGLISPTTVTQVLRESDTPEEAVAIIQQASEESKNGNGNGKVTSGLLKKKTENKGKKLIKYLKQARNISEPKKVELEEGTIVTWDIPLELWESIQALMEGKESGKE